MKQDNARKIRSNILYSIGVLMFLLFTLGPILWSFTLSITPAAALGPNSPILPRNPTLENYRMLLSASSQQGSIFLRGLRNSLVAGALSILIGIPIATLSAYPLARMRFRGRLLIKNLLLVTLVIPVFATIIPLYKIFAAFKLVDNMTALVIIYVTSFLPLSVWLISSFLESLPHELDEAATMDGCSNMQILTKILIPVSRTVIFAATLIVFLTTWNHYLIPLILAPSYATKPIAVVVSEFVTKTSINYGLMNAGGILAVIPPAIIAVLFRKFLVQGMVSGSTKG